MCILWANIPTMYLIYIDISHISLEDINLIFLMIWELDQNLDAQNYANTIFVMQIEKIGITSQKCVRISCSTIQPHTQYFD